VILTIHGDAEQVFTRCPIRCSIVSELEQLKKAIAMRTDNIFHDVERPTLAFSCGARTAFKLNERAYLRSMLSHRQLQALVMCVSLSQIQF
jgi:hypothetical protein